MTAATGSVAVGVFHDYREAEKAVEDLSRAGFRPEQIGVAARQGDKTEGALLAGERKAETAEVTGLVGGGVLGGLLGAGAVVAGLIPGVGPVIGAGLLATIAAGATAGAVAGTFAGALVGMGISGEEAGYYQGEFEAGRTIVTVKAGDRHDEAVAILRSHGAYGKGSPLI